MAEHQLLLSLADVARLADARRPVVSVWRSRSRASGPAFPEAAERRGGQELFNADAVAEWLAATGRGNNPDAGRDAAAFLAGGSVDPAELTAALALRALAAEPLAGLDAEDLLDLADETDPDDAFLYRELEDARVRLPDQAARGEGVLKTWAS